jgi:F-type H+-transporting ATPase subunit c
LFAQLLSIIHPLFAAASSTANETFGVDAGKAISIGVGAGGGAAGAGAGIGALFGRVYDAVARQPEVQADLTGLQWLGFALTEACFFYGLVGGLIGYVLA